MSHVNTLAEKAHYLTYTSGASGIIVCGLHLGDISAIFSICGVVFGVALQIYNAKRQKGR